MSGAGTTARKAGAALLGAALLGGAAGAAGAEPPAAQALSLSGDIAPTHDPVIIREGDSYYVFATGDRIAVKTSKDLRHWTDAGMALPAMPAWASEVVPGATGLWAPDIAFVNGEYRLYYSVSTFGSNRSAIGLATSPTLNQNAKNHKWTDHGPIITSAPGDDFNAIDPNFVIDREGRHWLALGSFWSGIKLFALDPRSGKPAPGTKPYSIASRPAPAGAPAPVEAPFIIPHGGFYYLLLSYDYCCKGVNSTYYTVVGRAKEITGPYVGKDGSSLMEGGGTIFLRADLQEQQRFRGPGHVGAFTDRDGTTYVAWHAYDKQANGAPTLRLAPVRWGADGWPDIEH